MANWIGTCRSNSVRITDRSGLDAAMKPFSYHIDDTVNGRVLFVSRQEGGAFSEFANVSDADFPIVGEPDSEGRLEFDPAIHICPFMAEGEVLVFKEVGAEGLLSLTGSAHAFNQAGESLFLSLDAIFELAAKAFKPVKPINAF